MQSRTDRLILRVLTGGLLLAALMFAGGCSTESDDIPSGPAITVDQMIEMGWNYLNDGNIDDALVAFQEAANAEASNLEAYLGLGYAFARSQEPISANRNLSNVISLGTVMLADGDLTQEKADTLFAEASAGQASVALTTQEYETAIARAQTAEMYWANFANPRHRWLPDFTLTNVIVIETQAWYGMGEYGETMMLLDQLDQGAFITDLLASGNLILIENDTVTVTLLEETRHTGVAQLNLEHDNLVYPVNVMQGDVAYSIVDYDITGNTVQFQANPVPSEGEQYVVSYYYAVDFGQFLIQLQEKLNEFQ